ncbi:hypothetical protein NFI96_004846 [Prochilodus magdalenae]|nr:hypothetical protein NFI96_004846 [Prochilodus magdalenae]
MWCQVSSSETALVKEQLRDALEKNQHWLVYDQQREAYVQGIVARMTELEQQLNQAKQALQQPHKEANLEGQSSPSTGLGQEQVLQAVQEELRKEREQTGLLQAELEMLRAQCKDRSQMVARAQEELHQERRSMRQMLAEERKLAAEQTARLQNEVDASHARLDEERKRASEMQQQVNLLQKSLLKQQEEQKRITILEQQIQMSAKDFENEKFDRQSLQHQLHKVLKELRKARDQITRLESSKHQREACFSEPSLYNRLDAQDNIMTTTSPAKTYNALDESFLECPNCRASYPTSQHRELLMHLDYCFN